MVARERQMQICDLLSINNAVQIADLAVLFGVSSETIRRDLLALEKGGLLHRTHGGAISLSRMAHGKDYAQRLNERLPQKRALAACAAEQIQEGDTVAVDSGTTAAELARCLPGRFERLTVVTHSFDVAQALKGARGIELILLGGYFLPEENACWGDFAVETAGRLHADKAFLCPSCVSLSAGATDYAYQLLPVQRAYLRMADRAYYLADSSKFEKAARLQIAPLSPDDVLITDGALPPEICELYRKSNIRIVRGRDDA